MNITLVNPPFNYFPNMPATRYKYCRPPLGICYLAGFVRKYGAGFNVRIIDAIAEHRTTKGWVDFIASQKPDVVGFSVVTPTADTAKEIALALKQKCPQTIFVAGGPHATVLPEDLLGPFDYVVIGEGEVTFLELLERLRAGESTENINGLAWLEDGTPRRATPRKLLLPLDNIPPPARDLLQMDAYYHSFPYNQSGGYFTTMFTARGCPNDCYFCANRILWNGKLRYHSVEYVMTELEHLVRAQGVSLIFIDDDNFLSNKNRAAQICENIIREKLPLKWICHSCVSSIDEDSLKIMKRAGCVEIQIGVETGDPSIASNLPKCGTTAEMRRTFELLNKSGINTWATFVIGHPGETRASIRNTISFARKIDPTYASFIVLLPFPGTRVFEMFKEKGWLKTTKWSDYTWHGDPVFEMPSLSSADLVKLRAEANTSFYLRPEKIILYIVQMVKAGSTRGELMRNFLSWLSLVTATGTKPKNKN